MGLKENHEKGGGGSELKYSSEILIIKTSQLLKIVVLKIERKPLHYASDKGFFSRNYLETSSMTKVELHHIYFPKMFPTYSELKCSQEEAVIKL